MGVEAKAWITGEYPNQEIHFELPSGPKGDPGGLTAATVLTTEDLNSVKTPGFYKQGSPGGASLSRNYPSTDFGSLMVYEYGFVVGTHLVQEYTPFNNILKGVYAKYIRANTAGGWSPWQLLSSTRIDKTSGTRIYLNDGTTDHMVYGDTGRCDITSLLPDGLTKSAAANAVASVPTLRRIGNIVYSDMYLDVTAEGISTLLTLPPGFRPVAALIRAGSMYQSKSLASQLPNEEIVSYVARGSGIRSGGPLLLNSTVIYNGQWETTEPWPTTLPGTPL